MSDEEFEQYLAQEVIIDKLKEKYGRQNDNLIDFKQYLDSLDLDENNPIIKVVINKFNKLFS